MLKRLLKSKRLEEGFRRLKIELTRRLRRSRKLKGSGLIE
jgi:hypothetical protein